MKILTALLILASLYGLYKLVGRLFWGTKEQSDAENLAESKEEAQKIVDATWKLKQFLEAGVALSHTAIVVLESDDGSVKQLHVEPYHPDYGAMKKTIPGQAVRFVYDEAGIVSVPENMATSFLRLAR